MTEDGAVSLRRTSHPSSPGHAVVIGGSVAGLCAAAAASSAGWRVTLLERDVLPEGPAVRRGVPQSGQSHILLMRGRLALEELFPGLGAELSAAGAPHFQMGRMPLLGSDGWAPIGDYGLDLLCASRPLIEHTIRQRVQAIPQVTMTTQARVNGLTRDSNGTWRVTYEHDDTAVSLCAELVIDASGRSSRLPVWLEDLGVPAAKTVTVDAQVGYATRRYSSTRPPGPGVLVMISPTRSRGCMVGPIEDGQWLVTTVGVGTDRPGRAEDAFDRHLASMPSTPALEAVREMTPVGEIAVHRQTANVRHRYEDVHRWPRGLLAVGDSLCAVNPIYGHGITVAACQGLRLRTALRAKRATLRTQRQIAQVTNLPWTMATSQDRMYATSSEPARLQEALIGAWGDQVGRLAMHGSLPAAEVMQRVGHLVSPPAAMFSPRMLGAVAHAWLRRTRLAPA